MTAMDQAGQRDRHPDDRPGDDIRTGHHATLDPEAGFTLIELMVVVGIIGVLIAIMIPTLLSARTPALDRQAQNLLRNSLTAAKTVETAEGVGADQASLAAADSAVGFVAGSATAPADKRQVSVANVVSGSRTYLILASHSRSGRCFALIEHPYEAPRFQRVDSSPTCRADQFNPTTGWADRWP